MNIHIITLVDDHSRFLTIYTLKHKSEAADAIKRFVEQCENQFNSKIKTIRSDNGKEYVNKEVAKYFEGKGIVHQTSCPYTPPQNGVAERYNKTILDKARCLIINAKAPKHLWAEAVHKATYIINRTPTASIPGCTPYEKWTGNKPNSAHMRIFGCLAKGYLNKEFRSKLDPKESSFMFIGYSLTQKGYKLLNPTTTKVVITRNVVFFEHVMYYDQKQDKSSITNQDVFYPWSDESDSEAEINESQIDN